MVTWLKNRFVHISHNQYASANATVFASEENDGVGTSYTRISGSTAEEAEFVSATPADGSNVVPPSAIAFVEFEDGTTAIVTHNKFYSKLDELSGGSAPSAAQGIKVLTSDVFGAGLPTEYAPDLGVKQGDVVAFYNNYTGIVNFFTLAVCKNVTTSVDSGINYYNYTWTEVYNWPAWTAPDANLS